MQQSALGLKSQRILRRCTLNLRENAPDLAESALCGGTGCAVLACLSLGEVLVHLLCERGWPPMLVLSLPELRHDYIAPPPRLLFLSSRDRDRQLPHGAACRQAGGCGEARG